MLLSILLFLTILKNAITENFIIELVEFEKNLWSKFEKELSITVITKMYYTAD